MPDTKHTPLYDTHIALGAKMAPFGGCLMPIQYTGIFKEHEATRTGATLFDTCHMGEFHLQGTGVIEDLERLVSCPIADLDPGQCRYGMLCNEEGGVIDDLLVYRLGNQAFMLVVNAGTQDGDFDWIREHCSPGTRIENRSATTAKIDLQGPGSPRIMNALVTDGILDLKYYRFKHTTYRRRPVLVSRTGYTGEVGFEIYLSPELAPRFWKDAMEAGAVCAGLGARDTLRLEMGMPLYGHELTTSRNAAEAGFARAIASDKPFIGHATVHNSDARQDALVGIQLDGRQAAREGDHVALPDGTPIGTVTSGSFAPSLGVAIALAYVRRKDAETGASVQLITRRKPLPGRIVLPPFYTDATARKPLSFFCD
jgi:aminomethyltransferase